nr:response regulator transcription factor [uncultured Carboxylicivirga sp.]
MKKKILLVDDKDDFRQLLRAILLSDYEVNTAKNGLEGLAIVQAGYFPDLIVTDLNMPRVDGNAFLEQIKASEIYRHIPIIILSSNDSSENKTNLILKGAADYLEKPFNPSELQARIKRLLNVSQAI